MRHPLDQFWKQLKGRHPQLYLADDTYDQSHVHHALVCVLAFGPIGVLIALVRQHAPLELALTRGLACGIAGGIVGYAIRECSSGRTLFDGKFNSQSLWDGFLDVAMPFTIGGVWSLSALFGSVPWWSGVALYVIAGALAFLYTFGRPDVLHYDTRKDPR